MHYICVIYSLNRRTGAAGLKEYFTSSNDNGNFEVGQYHEKYEICLRSYCIGLKRQKYLSPATYYFQNLIKNSKVRVREVPITRNSRNKQTARTLHPAESTRSTTASCGLNIPVVCSRHYLYCLITHFFFCCLCRITGLDVYDALSMVSLHLGFVDNRLLLDQRW